MYEGLSRNTNPATSHNAAENVNSKIPRLKKKILDCLEKEKLTIGSGLTSKEIADIVNEAHVTISLRMKPLEKHGMVRRTGRYRNKSVIWEVV